MLLRATAICQGNQECSGGFCKLTKTVVAPLGGMVEEKQGEGAAI